MEGAADQIDAWFRKRHRDRSSGIDGAARVARAKHAIPFWGEREARTWRPGRRRSGDFLDDVERMRRRRRKILHRDLAAGCKGEYLRGFVLGVSADHSPDGIDFDADLSGRYPDTDTPGRRRRRRAAASPDASQSAAVRARYQRTNE